jgi:hypothetical protein
MKARAVACELPCPALASRSWYQSRIDTVLKSLLLRVARSLLEPFQANLKRIDVSVRAVHLAQLKAAARYAEPRCLTRHGYRSFSQNEEDGVIDEIFRRIGTTNRFFVELGVETGVENNTLALLLGGWRGLWIEADPVHHEGILAQFRAAVVAGQLSVERALVTA